MNAHTFRTLSPAQAAQAADTSRWSIMRAINAGKLPATRDNRNCWRIAPGDLAAWRNQQRAHSAQCAGETNAAQVAHLGVHPPAHPDAALQAEVEELRVGLAVATARGEAAEARATAAEADRDAWRAQAARLAARPARRSWWPWGRF